jgi:hypothetical protein
MATSTSVQDMVRTGEIMDVYYYDADTSKKQAFPTTVNTKYIQAFANPAGGSSVFTIPPNNGIQDILCTFVMPSGLTDVSGLGLSRGWGYALIKQVSFRYGGSSQYFLTGDQILQNALRKQTSRSSVDDILTFGGNESVGLEINNSTAYVVLTLPHNIPSKVGKSNPLPTDLLTQQVQVTVELNPVSSVFTVQGSPVKVPPSQLAVATFQVQQVMLNNQSDALARRVDMAENAYAFPCEFVQQIQRIPLDNTASSQSKSLTGFRSGEVKAIHCWLTRTSDVGTGSTRIVNPFRWYPLDAVQVTYAGDVYSSYQAGSSFMWNLINGDKSPIMDNAVLSSGGGYSLTSAAELSVWHELPFAQTFEGEGQMNTLIHGKPITNGIINLDLTTPSAQSDWILNVSYLYNSTLLFSQGTADFVF